MSDYTPRKKVHVVSFVMSFDYPGRRGCGYGFPCNAKGEIYIADLHPSAKENLELCLKGGTEDQPIQPGYLVDMSHDYWESGTCRCDRCRSVVQLDDAWLNTCDNCGADYDGKGSLLAPREQWGEETGESLADILGPADPREDFG